MEKIEWALINRYVTYSKFTCEKHVEADLYILGYDTYKPGLAIEWDETNVHFRGLVVDGKGIIVARAFPKFFTFKKYLTKNHILLSENQSVKLPQCDFKILEKVDGSMAVLYWINNQPFLASQRSFGSPNALKATEILYSKYSHLFASLSKDVTYIFEVVYKTTRVMVNYGNCEDLILIGVLDLKTGAELEIKNIGFPIAKDYTQQYGSLTDLEDLAALNLPNIEGFVVKYSNGLNVKIKFPWFNEAHRISEKIMQHNYYLLENKRALASLLQLEWPRLSNYTIWECLKENRPIETILHKIPEEYYRNGFEQWLELVLSQFESKKKDLINISPSISENDIWNYLMPKDELFFDGAEGIYKSECSTTMWNFINRLENTYL